MSPVGRRTGAEETPVTSASPAPFSGQRKLIMTIGSAAGRHGIGLSWRQNALDTGFHGVPTGPARSVRQDRDADGVGVA
jgi:hypothetical protein